MTIREFTVIGFDNAEIEMVEIVDSEGNASQMLKSVYDAQQEASGTLS